MKIDQRWLVVLAAVSLPWLNPHAQERWELPQVIKGDNNSCELNSALLDHLVMEQRDTPELIFVIARLGKGEIRRSLSRERLDYARFYLLESGRTQKAKVVFAEGERIDGVGRLEFYLGSKLFLVSLAKRNKNVCLSCCEDYFPQPRRKRIRRR